MKKMLYLALVAVILFGTFLQFSPAKAAALTSMKDTMTRMQKNTLSDHVVSFVATSGVAAAGTITVTWPVTFVGEASIDYTDVDVTDNATPLTLAATASGATWGAVFSDDGAGTRNKLTITSDSGTITAGHTIVITIGLGATSGDKQILNPTSAANSIIISLTSGADSGTLAVAILDNDQVQVSGDVDEILEFSLSANSMALGTMTSSAVAKAATAVDMVTSTNADSGYAVTVQDVGSGSNPGLYNTQAAKLIASADATLAAGTEGYGLAAKRLSGSGATGTVDAKYAFDYASSTQVGGLLRTATNLMSATGPVDDETVGMKVEAAIASITPAGNYADTLTFICTGTF